jgi:hypothetical protein
MFDVVHEHVFLDKTQIFLSHSESSKTGFGLILSILLCSADQFENQDSKGYKKKKWKFRKSWHVSQLSLCFFLQQ